MQPHLFESLVSLQQLEKTLGYTLAEAEVQRCLKQAKFLTPKVGKFWEGIDGNAGIYIVVAGKVRLLDHSDELITTLETGDFFGEFTLFPEMDFQPYSARAGVNLRLFFLPSEVLSPLIAKHPQIREHLTKQARGRGEEGERGRGEKKNSPYHRVPASPRPRIHLL